MNKCNLLYVIYFLLAIVSIILISIYLSATPDERIIHSQNDPLSKTVFSMCGENFSFWPISHFLLYTIIGYLCPSFWMEATTIGICWELLEYNLGEYTSREQMSSKQYSGARWFRSSPYDIIFNTVGLMTGICLNNITKK